MKKLPVLVTAIIISAALISCEDDTNAEKGEKAAIEFCSCYETKAKDECEDELRDKYSNAEYTNSDFVAAFNKTAEASCGISITIYSY